MSPHDSKELVPLTQADNHDDDHHSNIDYNDENDSEDDTIRSTQQSSEITLATRDAGSSLSADDVLPDKYGSLDKADRFRNGGSVDEGKEKEKIISNGDDGRKKPQKKKEESVGWKDLPHKGQLAILTIARLAEPLVQTSLQASI